MVSTLGGSTGSGSDDSLPTKWVLVLGAAASTSVAGPIVLGEGEQLRIGRHLPHFDGALRDDRISRNHAEFRVEGGTLVIVDLESHNGTVVNGKRTQRAELQAGDAVGCGAALFVVGQVPGDWEPRDDDTLVGVGATHAAIVTAIGTVAGQSAPVLLTGPTGTGKNLVAHTLHDRSGRTGAFVSVDCGVIADDAIESTLLGPEGLVTKADGGTLYLDGVEDASDRLQSVLTPLVERGELRVGTNVTQADLRVVASCRLASDDALSGQTLRPSFAARLSQWVIELPALRERLEDLPALASAFAERFVGEPTALHGRLIVGLLRHPWPTNLHGLRGAVERAIVEAGATRPVPRARFLRVDPDAAGPSTGSNRLDLGPHARWFRCGGPTVDLEKRPTLARVLGALADRHRDRPDTVLSPRELLDAGWPDEAMDERAGINRVYVAISTLRKLGLRSFIVRSRSGYRLDPAVRLQRQD